MVIVWTQSVPLVNEFSLGDLVIVERDEGATVFRRPRETHFVALSRLREAFVWHAGRDRNRS
ncbi:MAG: hypothetical protein EA424_25155 [Planctomycetaceae bacterium]|nr:MAG: hypothetical protein EA424_25155 [Planctomycetaceae bacterium]